jgi:hypothetical protein
MSRAASRPPFFRVALNGPVVSAVVAALALAFTFAVAFGLFPF